ncbi:glycosyltransferase family 4 protein [Sphingobacterium phlebotomi]|uniref:Glycosyltransferase family 4 protein n=1 Tax=Sphingobacterium phlebotomi TaxID=2605433 RepID=A0A5D4H7L5_9SPHI|nr:glycosyltransferase family 4 protein [Sphingobacterium phlebotomi]TYR36524.1 glycosyltransferase family 4 protein [Sphingobacterium phlebotomi]
MKIVYCILNTWYSGGLTRVIANKANYLAEAGHDITIVTTDQLGKGHFYAMSDKIRFIDLRIHYVGFDDKSILSKLCEVPKRMLRHYKRLRKFLKEYKPDIVISTFGRELFVLPFIKDGSKKILEAHSSHFTWIDSRKDKGWFGKLHTWLDARMLRKFDKFVVLTEEDKPDWGKLSDIIVIPNANTVEPQETAALDNKMAVAAGRYGYQKNFESLIRAWTYVYPECPDWKLHLFGGGVNNRDLQNLVDKLGLTDVVVLNESKRNIFEEYLQSSMYILSSRYEGLGMVLLEAQAYGVPLVSYDCKCGPRDIIEDGENGFLVRTGDEKALADAIIRLAKDEALRKEMGSKAKQHSVKFSEEAIMKKWRDLFMALTNKN